MSKKILTGIKRRIVNPCYRRSYALDRLDKKLEPYLDLRGGFFIEAGANDGVRQSNTLYFERYLKWRGLLIEPIPDLAEQCRKNRSKCITENCALVSHNYDGHSIEAHYCDLMSTVTSGMQNVEMENAHLGMGRRHLTDAEDLYTIEVPARSLSSILDQHKIDVVDLLSLDVEGYETEVLMGLDFDRHRPHFMLIEVRSRHKIEQIIGDLYQPVAVLSIRPHYQDILYELTENLM